MAEQIQLHPTTDVDFEVLQDGQFVAMRFRSQGGAPVYAAVPAELLKKIYVNIPRVLGMAKEAREKAGMTEAASQVKVPELHNLTRVEFGVLDNAPDKACLIFELDHAMKLPTQADRTFLRNAMDFVQRELAKAG
ncbi:MAG TPA: hypothetical protein VFV71_06580 [Burkholderiales bacterium]|nr:hypothetical protein [Burkholderiales bacterium]